MVNGLVNRTCLRLCGFGVALRERVRRSTGLARVNALSVHVIVVVSIPYLPQECVRRSKDEKSNRKIHGWHDQATRMGTYCTLAVVARRSDVEMKSLGAD